MLLIKENQKTPSTSTEGRFPPPSSIQLTPAGMLVTVPCNLKRSELQRQSSFIQAVPDFFSFPAPKISALPIPGAGTGPTFPSGIPGGRRPWRIPGRAGLIPAGPRAPPHLSQLPGRQLRLCHPGLLTAQHRLPPAPRGWQRDLREARPAPIAAARGPGPAARPTPAPAGASPLPPPRRTCASPSRAEPGPPQPRGAGGAGPARLRGRGSVRGSGGRGARRGLATATATATATAPGCRRRHPRGPEPPSVSWQPPGGETPAEAPPRSGRSRAGGGSTGVPPPPQGRQRRDPRLGEAPGQSSGSTPPCSLPELPVSFGKAGRAVPARPGSFPGGDNWEQRRGSDTALAACWEGR